MLFHVEGDMICYYRRYHLPHGVEQGYLLRSKTFKGATCMIGIAVRSV
jgi:hypothetical protein